MACCCGGGGTQTCSDCNGVPDYFTVEIASLTGDCYNSTPTDADRNGTYLVPPLDDCRWRCYDTGIAIDVYYNSGLAKYIVEVWLFGSTSDLDRVVTWKKEYASKPTCSTLSAESITFDSDVGTCDGTSSTCSVTAGAAAGYLCCGGTISGCQTGQRVESDVQIVVTGVANLSPENCTTCTDINGTYVLTQDPDTCYAWNYAFPSYICEDCGNAAYQSWSLYLSDAMTLFLNTLGSNFVVWENGTLTTREFDCSDLGLYDGDLATDPSFYDDCCDTTGATFTITMV